MYPNNQDAIKYIDNLKKTNSTDTEILDKLSVYLKTEKSEFEQLTELLYSKDWPEAASSYLICDDSEQDKMDRAENILEFIDGDLKDKKFLDFGCGEGHIAKKAAEIAAVSVGYDIVVSGNLQWTTTNNFVLTTNIENLKQYAPYDFILLYDVLDHCKNPIETLQFIHTLCDQNTKLFIRCHPWTSRHATHLYKQLNKAYIHLIFTDQELEQLSIKQDFLQKTYYPVKNNNEWFKESNFKVISHDMLKTEVDAFLKNTPLITNRLKYQIYNYQPPILQMSQCFNDYRLKIN